MASSLPAGSAQPSAATPSSSAGAFLPTGRFAAEDSGVAFTVTIPSSGWTFDRQYTSLGKGAEVGNLPEAAVLMWAFSAGTEFYVPRDPCRSIATKPAAPVATASKIAASLGAQAARDATKPVDVTVGGHTRKTITPNVPKDAAFETCERGEFGSYGTGRDPLVRYHQGAGQIDQLWIFDVDGGVVIIDAMYRPDTPAALVAEMRSIAESATFGN